MPIEIVHGSRPGDNAIGKRVDSIVQQMEQEKQRALQASIEAARINAQMSAQRANLAMRNKEVDIEAANAAARNDIAMTGLQLDARRQDMQFAIDGGRLNVADQQNRGQFVMEAVKSGLLPKEVGASMLFGQDAGRYASAAFAQQDQSADLAQQLNLRQAAASQAELNPEGQNLYRQWASKLSAVLKSQSGIRPDRLNQVRQQLVQEFDALDLRRFQIKVPTIDEEWQQNAKQLDDGSWVVRERTKNGMTWRQLGGPKKGVAGQGPMSLDPDAQIRTVLQDRETYNKEIGAAAKRLASRREQMQKDAMILEQQKLDAEYDKKYAGKPDAPERPKASMPVIPPPTDEEVRNEMYRHLQGWHQTVTGGGGMPMAQGGPTAPMPTTQGSPTAPMPTAPPQPGQPMQPGSNASGSPTQQPLVDTLSTNGSAGNMPPNGSTMTVTREMRQQVEAANPALAELRKIGDPAINAAVNVISGVQAAIATGQMRPDDPNAQQLVQRAQMAIQDRSAKLEADRRASAAIKTIGKDKVEGALPSIKNAEDYRALPSGTTYRDPNGKVRIKP